MPRKICLCALALAACVHLAANAAQPARGPPQEARVRAERTPAAPALSDKDLLAVDALFRSMDSAFLLEDPQAAAQAVCGLFAGSAEERQRLCGVLEKEFRQLRYRKFSTLVTPDDEVAPNTHSVDVEIEFAYVYRSRPGEEFKDKNIYTFDVLKLDDGSFALLRSEFFDGLGRHEGVGRVVQVVLLAVIGAAFLVFWVWMGWEALRARPRSAFWRVFVFVPALGASGYFLLAWLPHRLQRKS